MKMLVSVSRGSLRILKMNSISIGKKRPLNLLFCNMKMKKDLTRIIVIATVLVETAVLDYNSSSFSLRQMKLQE